MKTFLSILICCIVLVAASVNDFFMPTGFFNYREDRQPVLRVAEYDIMLERCNKKQEHTAVIINQSKRNIAEIKHKQKIITSLHD